uniref:GntR family transcriptional regulator n=1 Tax=Nonomuraea bangladeshensis TaxID=404385 RepID=UPI003F498480
MTTEPATAPGKAAAIQGLLLTLIETLPEGETLPSERQLAKRWHVARMTLRRAIDELVLQDLLIRRHGRGTFTRRPKVDKSLSMVSFSEDIRRKGMTPASRIIDFRHLRADRAAAHRLRIPVGDPIVCFTRLRLADDMPMLVERTIVPEAYTPGLHARDLDGSLYELFASRYSIEVVSITSKMEPVMPEAKTAEWLGIPVTQPCLASYGTAVDRRGRACEYTSGVYRGDKYMFRFETRMPRSTRSG